MNNFLLLFSCTEDTLLPMVDLNLWRTILKYVLKPEMYPLEQDEDD